MTISLFDLFSRGIGPSSSHTVGPMRAAKDFVDKLIAAKQLDACQRVQVDLYGSLALTGHGHGSDLAVLNGLAGEKPETIDPTIAKQRLEEIKQHGTLHLGARHEICFDYASDLVWQFKQTLPKHSNAMKLSAYGKRNKLLLNDIYYSIGGGFILCDSEPNKSEVTSDVPYPFLTAKALFDTCREQNCSVAAIMWENEKTWHREADIKAELIDIWTMMQDSIECGCQAQGELPGGLNVPRRAPALYQQLKQKSKPQPDKESDMMNWLNLYAIAVNEENAAGGRIVTAPTNGAAGVIPAVLQYYLNYHKGASEAKAMEFLLTAGAIALLYKHGASISAAEVGCQGEIGVASSMAAGALTAVLGGTLTQIENAAEIAMEHHLGMTCDPIGGLVQIPCIERNAMGAVKAVNATRLALLESHAGMISLDKVIKTMKETGDAMSDHYKETSLGGLAVNHPEC